MNQYIKKITAINILLYVRQRVICIGSPLNEPFNPSAILRFPMQLAIIFFAEAPRQLAIKTCF